jgi:hypothetical protein
MLSVQNGYRYYLTPTCVANGELVEPSLGELARVITAGTGIEVSFQRGKSEAGMDEYQVRTWEGWHHHMALTLTAVWFLIKETYRGQQWTPAICRQVHRQLLRNELARCYHHRTHKCLPPRKLRRDIQ